MATATLTPFASSIAKATPVNPSTDPTDRSMPAVMMVNSSP